MIFLADLVICRKTVNISLHVEAHVLRENSKNQKLRDQCFPKKTFEVSTVWISTHHLDIELASV